MGSYCYLLFEATVLSYLGTFIGYPLLQAAPKILLPSSPRLQDLWILPVWVLRLSKFFSFCMLTLYRAHFL